MVARTFRARCSIALLLAAGASSNSTIASAAPGTPVFDASGYAVVRPWFESYRVLALAVRTSDAGGPGEISTISTMSTLLRVERWSVTAQGVPYLNGFVPTQYRPTAVAWADVNGDGAADLLCGEESWPLGPVLEVLLMGPSGPVAPGQLFVLPSPQRGPVMFVTSADVNGDGFVDVGVVGSGSDRIEGRMSWVLGGASGLTVGPTSQNYYSKPAISRLDLDAQPDLVSWEPASLRLDFAHGNGDGTFSLAPTTAEGSGMPQLADLDADGRNDLIAGRFLYRGDPSGIPVEVDSLAANVTARVDLDHDGLGDLIAIEDGRIRVARGLGGFRFGPFSDLRCGSIADRYPLAQQFGLSGVLDVNADSWTDVVGTSAASLGRVVYVVPGRIGGSFFGPLRLSTGSRPAQVGLADLVGHDGRLDMVVLARGAARLEVRAGGGDGAFGPAQFYPLPEGGRRLAIADLDADGYLEVAVACDTSNVLSIYRGTVTGLGSRTDFPTDSPLTDLQIADVDEDGTLDVLAMTVGGRLRGWKGTGGLTLIPAPWSAAMLGDGRLRLADWDGDGHLDLVTREPGTWSFSIRLLKGAGDGTFGFCVTPPCGGYPFGAQGDIQAQSGTAIDVADLLGDGDTYVAYASSDSLDIHYSYLRAFRGDSNGFHPIPAHYDFPTSPYDGYEVAPQPRQLTIADVTGDGLPDAVTLSGASGVLTVVPGLGGGLFGTPIAHVVGTDPSSFALGDVDGDGWPDAVVADSGSDDVLVLRNLGGSTLSVGHTAPPSRMGVRIASAPNAASVKFEVQLHADGEARLEIFDAQGRRLHAQRLEPSSVRDREVVVDARALPPSGVLFARLSQAGVAASAAFVRLR
jgi:hypothetical protein